jgi:hypothetical protein
LRLLVIDGFELDLPDTPANAAEFGYAGSGANRSAFCKARVVAVRTQFADSVQSRAPSHLFPVPYQRVVLGRLGVLGGVVRSPRRRPRHGR